MKAIVLGAATFGVVSSAALAGESAKELERVRKDSLRYAVCVVRKHHEKASDAILATAGNAAIISHFSPIIDGECLASTTGAGGTMRFPYDSYRYVLADALVNAEFSGHGEASFADRLPLAQPALSVPSEEAKALAEVKGERRRKEMTETIAKAHALAAMARYGECVVRQDPESARYWILTPADTPEETSRIKVLQPAFELCLGEGTVRFSRSMMRGTVAVNYYRLARATVVPGAGSVH